MTFKQQNQTEQEENIETIEYWTWTLTMIIMLENIFNVQQVQASLPDPGVGILKNKINKTYLSSQWQQISWIGKGLNLKILYFRIPVNNQLDALF